MDKAVEIFNAPLLQPGELKTAVVVEDFKTAFPHGFDDSSAGFALQLAERVHLRFFRRGALPPASREPWLASG